MFGCFRGPGFGGRGLGFKGLWAPETVKGNSQGVRIIHVMVVFTMIHRPYTSISIQESVFVGGVSWGPIHHQA